MKFCRFELLSDEGAVRTGIAYEGRVYETDGTNAIGIHEAADVRILAPIGRPPTVRIFRQGEDAFDYAHPAAMHGPNALLPVPPSAERLGYAPCLAVVVTSAPLGLDASAADDVVLGLAFAHAFSTLRELGGRAFDVGYCVGPALVTPDEFASDSIRPEGGAVYADVATLFHNGVEVAALNLGEIDPNPARAIAIASETQPMLEGDLLLIPIAESPLRPEVGDEIRLSSPKLGSLGIRLIAK